MKDILDHIVDHVRVGLPSLKVGIIRQSIKSDSPTKFVLLTVYNGIDNKYSSQAKIWLQVLCQDDTDEKARQLSKLVYDFLVENYDLELAAPSGKPELSPALISQIKPTTIPVPLGDAGNGRYRYSFDLEILYGEV